MISNIIKKCRFFLFMNSERGGKICNEMDIYSDDIFLVSYPKSGNTWLRFLIGNYLTENRCDFKNSHLIVPDIHYNPQQCINIKRPRFIKSHFPFSYNFSSNKYPKVVYIVRDGRDVAVSYYFFLKKLKRIKQEMSFDEYLLMFNQGIIDKFSNWSLHVNFWIDYSKCKILIVRYEDMKRSTPEILERILLFSGVPVEKKRIIEAVEASRFENMQKQEKISGFMKGDVDIPIVRNGEVGNWRSLFTDKSHEDFVNIHKSALERFNYL